MKSIPKFLAVALVLGIALAGCKKDDPVNYLNVGDLSCVLTQGNVIYQGTSTNDGTPFYVYNIELFSQGVELGTDLDGYPTYDGSGAMVYISLFSSGATRPASGSDYEYHEWSAKNHALNGGYFNLDYNPSTKALGNTFGSGTVTVKGSGDSYTILFEGTGSDGEAISMRFTGQLESYDGSDWYEK